VKAFGALGDASTDDTAAIQRALDELYTDTDKNDTRSRRLLFFPAGQYNISSTLTIPPYANLIGEGADRTTIYYSGSAAPVARTQDNAGNEYPSISAVVQNINIEQITFRNGTAHTGFSIDCAKDVRFVRCKFQGTYASSGADVPNSKGVTVVSTTAIPSSNIIFDSCMFTKFSRLVDLDYDVTGVRFINCDFNTAFYGAYIGDDTDGSSNGLIYGPRNVQFLSSTWSTIGKNAILVDAQGSIRQIVSAGNWFSSDVGNTFGSYDDNTTGKIVPVIQFSADECTSLYDYFERTDLRSSSVTPAPEIDGVSMYKSAVKTVTLANNQSSAANVGFRWKASDATSVMITYQISRGGDVRTGNITIVGMEGTTPATQDDSTETSDVGVTFSVSSLNQDSTAGNEEFVLQYQTTNTGSAATLRYQVLNIA
jgi:hypothetical protein